MRLCDSPFEVRRRQALGPQPLVESGLVRVHGSLLAAYGWRVNVSPGAGLRKGAPVQTV